MERTIITVEANIAVPVEKAWECWTNPTHILNWNNASDDWHTTRATNDLRVGHQFLSRMEAKDGSFGFDFTGTYAVIEPYKKIEYNISDGRNVKIDFTNQGNTCRIVESFEPEQTHTIEMQRSGWQSILNNFKKYVETT